MSNFFKHTYIPKTDNSFIRGNLISPEIFKKISDGKSYDYSKFGINTKDVIEFSAYSNEGDLVGWKTIEQTPVYSSTDIEYTDYEGNTTRKRISTLDSLYPKTKQGGLIISPRSELLDLGITDGSFKYKISFRNDIVGSYENSTKLIIEEISNDRTELKAIPSALKDSSSPDSVAFNFEYTNFLQKNVLVAHVFNNIDSFLKKEDFISEIKSENIKNKTSDYDFYINLIKKNTNFNELQILKELDGLYTNIKVFYNSLIFSQINDVFSKERFYSEYVNSVDYFISKYPYFLSGSYEREKLFFKYMLIQKFDLDALNLVFYNRFDKYLSNIANFGNGLSVPFLKYKNSVDETKPDNTNNFILLKFIEPLPAWVDLDLKFYISKDCYADDIVGDINLVTPIQRQTNKLRGPILNYKKSTRESTHEYSLSGKNPLLKDEDLQSATDFFKTTSKEIDNLNVDYSDFKNFVHFSSARKRIDNFVLKLTKISKIKFKILEKNKDIINLTREMENGIVDSVKGEDSIQIIRNQDIKNLEDKITDEIKNFNSYEKFLYFENDENAWPRDTLLNISGFKNGVIGANGIYKIHLSVKYDLDKVFLNELDYSWKIIWDPIVFKWKLFNETLGFHIYSNNTNLSSGFTANEDNNIGFENQSSNFNKVFLDEKFIENEPTEPPQLISDDINVFMKSDGYAWYKSKARQAELYDKSNDEWLKNNIPEFLTRYEENEDFVSFISMLGEMFDTILIYIKSMTDMSNIRNNPNQGIPNNMVWFVMNSLGVNFFGKKLDNLSVNKLLENNRNNVWRRLLNNLPYLLKTSGTEASIRGLLKCYGVPDYLFNVREFGGINYSTDSEEENSKYRLDVFDYGISFSEGDQYLQLVSDEDIFNTDEISIEFRLSIDSSIFDSETNQTFFDDSQEHGVLPHNYGKSVDIDRFLVEDSFLIGSNQPRFYSKGKRRSSYRPETWSDEFISLSWKNFREGVSFTYPKIKSGNTPTFMTIYSDEALQPDGTYDPIFTLAEIGATDTLNGEIVRLQFNQDNFQTFLSEYHLDFYYVGSVEGTHYTLSQLKNQGLSLLNKKEFPIIHGTGWECGVTYEKDSNRKFGRFYFKFNNPDGVLHCPPTDKNPIFFDKQKKYDILIKKYKKNIDKDSRLEILVKNVVDSDIKFESSNFSLVSAYSSNKLLNFKDVYIGNYKNPSYLGDIDRIRIYSETISEKRFLNHINFNEGYDVDNPDTIKESLKLKVNFDYPFSLSNNSNEPTEIKNHVFSEKPYIKVFAYNFKKTEFPYDFVGTNRREIISLPTYGAQSFNNDKIRIEKQELVTSLRPDSRSTKKSSDRHSIDTNTLGLYFSSTDLINREIIRFFGDFKLSEYIGDPLEIDKNKYKKLESFKKVFFNKDFGKIDVQKYFNLLKGYIDPSLFDNVEKLIPARSRLIAGLVVEPSILERHKIPLPKITSHGWINKQDKPFDKKHNKEKTTKIVSINFDLKPKNKLSSFANERDYTKNINKFYRMSYEGNILSKINKKTTSYNFNYGTNTIGETTDLDKISGFSVYGYVSGNSSEYKIIDTTEEKSRATRFTGKYIEYDSLYSESLEISGFDYELGSANGLYDFKFKNSSNYPVFCNISRTWWVFYSTIKQQWIIASDGRVGGAKELATEKQIDFSTYTWVAGNKNDISNNIYMPSWFSNGFNNSNGSGNIDTSITYFANCNLTTSYNRFIDVDAYINGWVYAEISGIFSGKFTERIKNSDNSMSLVSNDTGEYKFYGNKRYVYFNGNFIGKFQNGWVGSSEIDQTVSEKVIRIVGYFNGKKYESCGDPFFTSGNINSIVSFDNRDRSVFDFKTFDERNVSFNKKQFKSFGLIKKPNFVLVKNKFNISHRGEFLIENKGLSDKLNFNSGIHKKNTKIETLDTFYPPKIFNLNFNLIHEVFTDAVVDMEILGRTYKFDVLEIYKKIKIDEFEFELENTSYEKFNVNILFRKKRFSSFKVYSKSGFVENINQEMIDNLEFNTSLNIDKKILDDIKEKYKNKIDFSFLLIGGETISSCDILFVLNLSKNINFKSNLNLDNFLQNTSLYAKNKKIKYEKTPLIKNKTANYIKDIQIIKTGRGYSGDEHVYFDGTKPNGWKDVWPQKIKVKDLFNLDEFGSIQSVNYNHFMLSGMNWKQDKTLTFSEPPNLKINKPNEEGGVVSEKKYAKIIPVMGEVAPKIETNVNIKKLGNITLGDTIGAPLTISNNNTYLRARSNIYYNMNLVHNQEISVITKLNKKVPIKKRKDILLLTSNLLNNFNLIIESNSNKSYRTDLCGNGFPSDCDTYKVEIRPYKDYSDKEFNKFFIIDNETNFNDNLSDIDINEKSKFYNNRISSGYIKLSGFYGDVYSANGIYNLESDVILCSNKTEKVYSPTYINKNNDWVLMFDDELNKWNLRESKTGNYIISESSSLSDGFLASRYNNKGFFKGDELVITNSSITDKNGKVYNDIGDIIGSHFQRASVKVYNSFTIIPNKFLIEKNKENISEFYVWKIQISSRKTEKIKYEIPLIYLKHNLEDEEFNNVYNSIINSLKEKTWMQTQEVACDLAENEPFKWRVTTDNKDTIATYSDINNIRAFGNTSLVGMRFGNNEAYDVFTKKYTYVVDQIKNDLNSTLAYYDQSQTYLLENDNIILRQNHKYPPVGTFKSTTRNLFGYAEYKVRDGELLIEVRGYEHEYESANGLYRNVLYSYDDKFLFKNKKNWCFVYDAKNNKWIIQNSYKYPSLKCILEDNINQTGIYTKNEDDKSGIALNFDIIFEYEDNFKFLNIDTNSIKLSGTGGNYRIYDRVGKDKTKKSETELELNLNVINAKIETDYFHKLHINNIKNKHMDLLSPLDLHTESEIEINSDEKICKVKFSLNIPKTKKTNEALLISEFNLDKPLIEKEIYSNEFKIGIEYKKGEIVYYEDNMWSCKRDTLKSRSIVPGKDFDSGLFWEKLNSYNLRLKSKLQVNSVAREIKNSSYKNYLNFKTKTLFSEEFSSKNSFENGIYKDYNLNLNKSYEFEKDFQSYDVFKIGQNNNVFIHGRISKGLNGGRRKYKSINTHETVVNETGKLSNEPPIIRTPKLRDGGEDIVDSFWFNFDSKIDNETKTNKTKFVKPEINPVIKLNGNNINKVSGLKIKLDGFKGIDIVDANGVYLEEDSLYNNMPIFSNSTEWIIYKESDMWILAKLKSPKKYEDIDTDQYITSNDEKLTSSFNGNYGFSDNFKNEVGLVELLLDFDNTPTPTVSHTYTLEKSTPTPTITLDDESPDTPIPPNTPTPTITPLSLQTPTPTITQTKTEVENNLLVFKFNNIAITNKKYDLSSGNPSKTEEDIIIDLRKEGIQAESIASVEDLLEQRFLLEKIPETLQNFNVKVNNISNITDDVVKLNDLSKYGWDSSNVIKNGKFRTFYLSRNELGREHKYLKTSLFKDEKFYLKSWFGEKNIMVKLKSNIDPVTFLNLSSGRHDGILIKWRPSKSAKYVRIERSQDDINWETVVDNLSQTYSSTGYLDTTCPLGKKIFYRIISIGHDNSKSASYSRSSWRIGKPQKIKTTTASNSYPNMIKITWDDTGLTSEYNRTDYYTVLRSTTNDFKSYSTYQTLATDIKTNSFTDLNFVNDIKTYYYVIVSNNSYTENLNELEYEENRVWSDSFVGNLSNINTTEYNYE